MPNKKILFTDHSMSDVHARSPSPIGRHRIVPATNTDKKSDLFKEEDTDDENINFNIKEQFEGKNGLKVYIKSSHFVICPYNWLIDKVLLNCIHMYVIVYS